MCRVEDDKGAWQSLETGKSAEEIMDKLKNLKRGGNPAYHYIEVAGGKAHGNLTWGTRKFKKD